MKNDDAEYGNEGIKTVTKNNWKDFCNSQQIHETERQLLKGVIEMQSKINNCLR